MGLSFGPEPLLADLLEDGDSLRHWAGKEKGILAVVNGCFDPLHAGHLALIHRAVRLGDKTLMLVNMDDHIREVKGREPYLSLPDRTLLLRSLRGVSAVHPFAGPDPTIALRAIADGRKGRVADIMVKGGDYRGRVLPERGWVRRIVFLDRTGESSSDLIARMRGER